ncbi:hypothetical protein NXF25_004551 [Crotalus adamanteus]|uniref:Uncharacterized protein n=1 Tax=Crotalus adamanteus TaxID=8729 RepID=A0AAW1BWP6_CROAD
MGEPTWMLRTVTTLQWLC